MQYKHLLLNHWDQCVMWILSKFYPKNQNKENVLEFSIFLSVRTSGNQLAAYFYN